MIEPKRLMEIEAATFYECPQHEAGMAGLACSCLPATETRTMFRELIEALREAGEAPFLLDAVIRKGIAEIKEQSEWMPEATIRDMLMAMLRNQAFGS